jgi:solute carrier family 25 protein 39/40
MMYWYSVEKLRSALAGQFSNENPKMDSLAAAFVSGNIAGAAISAVTTPVDVLKTRIQVDVAHSNKTGVGTGGRGGLLRELTNLVKHEGASSLFKGVVPRALRGGPTCGIVLVAYELVKSY